MPRPNLHLPVAFVALAAALLSSCSSVPFFSRADPQTDAQPPALPQPGQPEWVNPHPPGTYEHFVSEPGYRKTYNVYRNHDVLNSMAPESASLKISLSDQRAQLLSDGVVAMDYPVSTGRSSHPTDTGDFQILEKIKDKRSNTYGKIYDASGNLVNGDADARKDEIPAGGKYVGASMPYWMRFTWTGIGHHIGRVPRYPASHGCIRGTRSVLPTIYEKVKVGTPVTITP